MKRNILPALALLSALVIGFIVGGQIANVALDGEFNGNQDLWLRSVAGDNSPRDATPDKPVSNIFTACLDGDLYVVGYSPGVGLDPNYVSLDVTYDYENWCPDDLDTNHNPFEEDES